MIPSELTQLLELHRRFVTGLREGARANLSSKYLAGANLANCNLQQLIAPGANFTKCSLVDTDLSFADLFGANLSFADKAMSVQRAVSRKKGSWWQVPKSLA